jgi:hypothetical protein
MVVPFDQLPPLRWTSQQDAVAALRARPDLLALY